MAHAYEQFVAITYVVRMVRATWGRRQVGAFVVDWAERHGPALGIDLHVSASGETGGQELRGHPDGGKSRTKECPDEFEAVREMLESRANGLRRVRPSALERRIREIAKIVGLDSLETALLGALIRFHIFEPAYAINEWWQQLDGGPMFARSTRLLGWILEASRHDIAARFAADGRLMHSGLVRINYDGEPFPLDTLVNALQAPAAGKESLVTKMLGAPSKATLDWDDFDHIAEDRDHMLHILEGALAHKERGIHVLLHGPPGTGKTELCRTLAARLGVPLHSVGEADEAGNELGRSERLAAIMFAQRLLSRHAPSLLLFDEVEDLFDASQDPHAFRGGEQRRSRVYVHRLLERAPVPTLWTTNSLAALGPAVVRRMTCVVELDTPPPRVRSRMWQRQLAWNGVELTESEIHELGHRFEAPPALAATAVRSARLAGGGVENVRWAVTGLARALGRESPPVRCAGVPFEPDLANAEIDLERLAERLSRPRAPRRFSLCLYGPPGTGKSLFVRYLAERMGLEVMEQRASDLLSKWVGETEKGIAQAFSQARRRRAFLVFDEADSLLVDRRFAMHSWEVSQVNEMLTWMECHDLPFACTTNLPEHLDDASLRRFTLRLRLSYLTREQARLAFRRFFGVEPPPSLDRLDLLTPGDFEVVKRRAFLLGFEADRDTLVAMLRNERAAKPGAGRSIGFKVSA